MRLNLTSSPIKVSTLPRNGYIWAQLLSGTSVILSPSASEAAEGYGFTLTTSSGAVNGPWQGELWATGSGVAYIQVLPR